MLIEKHNAVLEAAKHVFTWTTKAELAWLAEQAMFKKAVLEIGTYMGASALVMHAAMQQGARGSLTCIDIFETPGAEQVARTHLDGKATVLAGDAALIGRRLWLQNARFDMLWIDDGHNYSDVTRDILAAQVLAMPGALICGHDYEGAVKKAVDDCFRERVKLGPDKVWFVESSL